MDSYYELSMEQEVALDRAFALADAESTRVRFAVEIRQESKESLAEWIEELVSIEDMVDYLQDNEQL